MNFLTFFVYYVTFLHMTCSCCLSVLDVETFSWTHKKFNRKKQNQFPHKQLINYCCRTEFDRWKIGTPVCSLLSFVYWPQQSCRSERVGIYYIESIDTNGNAEPRKTICGLRINDSKSALEINCRPLICGSRRQHNRTHARTHSRTHRSASESNRLSIHKRPCVVDFGWDVSRLTISFTIKNAT